MSAAAQILFIPLPLAARIAVSGWERGCFGTESVTETGLGGSVELNSGPRILEGPSRPGWERERSLLANLGGGELSSLPKSLRSLAGAAREHAPAEVQDRVQRG